MKVLFNDLSSYNIEKLVINSLEHALYQAVVVVNGEEHVVWENVNKTVLARSLTKMRERFEHLDIANILLRQESAYDEMIGQEKRQASNRMEVALGKNMYPVISE